MLCFAVLTAKSFEIKARFNFLRALNSCNISGFKIGFHKVKCCGVDWSSVNVLLFWVTEVECFRQCCSLGFFPSLYGLCCWHHLSATNSSKIAEINLILFLRLFSEFPDEFLVTLLGMKREKRRYIHIYVIHPHRCTSVSLRQVVSIRKLETLLCPRVSCSSNVCSAQKEGFVPSLQSQAARAVLQELESFWWGSGKESSDGAQWDRWEIRLRWRLRALVRLENHPGTQSMCLLPRAVFVQMQPHLKHCYIGCIMMELNFFLFFFCNHL